MKTLKLMTPVTDIATGLSGFATTLWVDTDHRVRYMFQPTGINPENGQPVDRIDLELGRLEGYKESDMEDIDIPLEVLGTHVRDRASGFEGTATILIKHPNGCCHVMVQPKGVLKKTNSPIQRRDFDMRQLEGEKVPNLDEEQLRESKKKKPSPDGDAASVIDASVPV